MAFDTHHTDLPDAQATAIVTLASNCWHLRMVARLENPLAGQYIQLVTPSGLRRFFSLASRPILQPDGTTAFELMITSSSGENGTAALIAELKNNGRLRIAGPFGTATLRPPAQNSRYLFVAYDSGYAYTRGLLDALRYEQPTAPATFFRFSRSQPSSGNDAYLTEESTGPNPVHSIDISPRENWPIDPASFVLNQVSTQPNSMNINSIYIGGSRNRTLALANDLICAHVPASLIISDHLNQKEQQKC